MSNVRTEAESQALAAIQAATVQAETEYRDHEALFAKQGISKEQYVRGRLQDANVPEAYAEPQTYEDLVKALADGKRVDKRRQDALCRVFGRTEADLLDAVVNA